MATKDSEELKHKIKASIQKNFNTLEALRKEEKDWRRFYLLVGQTKEEAKRNATIALRLKNEKLKKKQNRSKAVGPERLQSRLWEAICNLEEDTCRKLDQTDVAW